MTDFTNSDRDLFRRVQRKDSSALDALMDRYYSKLQLHVVRIVHDSSLAEDIVQEVFLRVWTRAEQWEDRGRPIAWLKRIATNLALNTLRQRSRWQLASMEGHGDSESDDGNYGWTPMDRSALPDEILQQQEQQHLLEMLISRLSPQHRQVLKMAHRVEMDIQEIADVLHIPSGTVKSRLYYARAKLVREWDDFLTSLQ